MNGGTLSLAAFTTFLLRLLFPFRHHLAPKFSRTRFPCDRRSGPLSPHLAHPSSNPKIASPAFASSSTPPRCHGFPAWLHGAAATGRTLISLFPSFSTDGWHVNVRTPRSLHLTRSRAPRDAEGMKQKFWLSGQNRPQRVRQGG